QVQRQVHGGEDQCQRQHGTPLPACERGKPRPRGGQQQGAGHPLAYRDHAGRPKGREGQRRGCRAELIGRGAAGHQGDPGGSAGLLSEGRTAGGGGTLLAHRDGHGRSMAPASAYAKCMHRGSHTLWLWIWSCGTCAAWSRSWTREPSPTPRSNSASHRPPCRATSWHSNGSSASSCCTAPAGTSPRPPPACTSSPRPRRYSPQPTTWAPTRSPATPRCASATRGRPWAGTPASSSAAGPPAIPTSNCT